MKQIKSVFLPISNLYFFLFFFIWRDLRKWDQKQRVGNFIELLTIDVRSLDKTVSKTLRNLIIHMKI